MTFIYELDLGIARAYLPTKMETFQVKVFNRAYLMQTDRQMMRLKTLPPCIRESQTGTIDIDLFLQHCTEWTKLTL